MQKTPHTGQLLVFPLVARFEAEIKHLKTKNNNPVFQNKTMIWAEGYPQKNTGIDYFNYCMLRFSPPKGGKDSAWNLHTSQQYTFEDQVLGLWDPPKRQPLLETDGGGGKTNLWRDLKF